MVERVRQIREALSEELRRLGDGRTALELVEELPGLEAFFDDVADARIAAARASGATWADIAGRLGVSRQAVHKRFGAGRRRRGLVLELRLSRSKGKGTDG